VGDDRQAVAEPGILTVHDNGLVKDRHRRIASALMAAAEPSVGLNPYVVRHLSGHVAAAGAWDELASSSVLDHLDPNAVAADAFRTVFGSADLPVEIAGIMSCTTGRPRHRGVGPAVPGPRATERVHRLVGCRWRCRGPAAGDRERPGTRGTVNRCGRRRRRPGGRARERVPGPGDTGRTDRSRLRNGHSYRTGVSRCE
jgi:hypothetical protein